MKRIILTLSNEEHAQVKTYSAAIQSDIQRVGITALNEHFAKKGVDIKLSETVKKD